MSEKVETLQRLAELAQENRALSATGKLSGMCNRRPAAFVLRMQGAEILRLIQSGLYVYEPKSKQENK